MLYENIKKLVEYGIQTGLTPECERIYTTNLLLELFLAKTACRCTGLSRANRLSIYWSRSARYSLVMSAMEFTFRFDFI